MSVKKIKKTKNLRKKAPAKRIYMDYAAATPVDPRIAKKITSNLAGIFANTMSLHSFGQDARDVLEYSRETLAEFIGAKSKEIIFTGSATESNNTVLKGVAFANKNKGNHIIISKIEHACILESAKWLEGQGFEVTRVGVDRFGIVDPEEVKKSIKNKTILVSVMHANNEIGTIEPVSEIGKICRKKNVYFHTDAAQTLGKVPVDVSELNADLLTASAQKMYAPKGAAILYLREGVKIEPLLHGGGQEFGLRSSTVNVPSVYGFAEGCRLSKKEMKDESKKLVKMRDRLISGVLRSVRGSHLNGHPKMRLPNNAHFWFEFVEGESLIFKLDLAGIAASTGSACSSSKLEPSHVLLACGLKPQEAHGSLRASLGRWTRESDIDYFLKVLPKIIAELRIISPFKNEKNR